MEEIILFATMPDHWEHNSHEIWAHLEFLLEQCNEYPKIDTMHFASDGPLSQYQDRFNLYLLKQYIPEWCPDIKV